MDDRFDLIVIGAGIVGLATSYRILERHPDLRLAVLEKEGEVSAHQSGHNSGVIHAGIYYRPGTFRARLCREGKAALEAFAEAHGIPFKRCGKLVVALGEEELGRLGQLEERARANGVPDLEMVGPERMREIEPHIVGLRALWSPTSGVIDFKQVARTFAEEVRARGGTIVTGTRVTGLARTGEGWRVRVSRHRARAAGGPRAPGSDDVLARHVIACAGLHSDRVAAMTGDAGDLRIIPFRGDYYTFRESARHLVRGLVNPVPDPRFPFLGVHFTRREDGEVWAGPNAVLAFSREGYRMRDVSGRDLGATFSWSGFWKLLGKYGETAVREMWRDAVKGAFVRELQRYLPEIRGEDLVFGPSGVRAQSVSRDGALLDDFSFGESDGILHVRNAPSPAATSSLAIGRHLAERAAERFGWRAARAGAAPTGAPEARG
jgi:L-2-hydroxyglutarate oxidase